MKKWRNLLQNKCPSCNAGLKDDHGIIRCGRCRFYIRGQRFKEIVSEMSKQEVVGTIGESSDNDDLF